MLFLLLSTMIEWINHPSLQSVPSSWCLNSASKEIILHCCCFRSNQFMQVKPANVALNSVCEGKLLVKANYSFKVHAYKRLNLPNVGTQSWPLSEGVTHWFTTLYTKIQLHNTSSSLSTTMRWSHQPSITLYVTPALLLLLFGVNALFCCQPPLFMLLHWMMWEIWLL